MRQHNALCVPVGAHLSRACVSVARAQPAAPRAASRSRLITLFEEVRLVLTGSLRPAAALHRIPSGLGAEGLVIEEMSRAAARVAATFPP